MQKKIMHLEIAGIFFVIIVSVFLQNLYELSGYTLIGILFGSVNDSIWESTKTLLLPYLVWAIIELMCVRVPFHKFVAAKTITLYALGISYILISGVMGAVGSATICLPQFTAALLCVSFSAFASFRLLFSQIKCEILFAPSFFMLLLFLAFFCSFTPFPPKIYIFMDRATGFYGLIPHHIDTGALVLDTLYNV